MAHYPHTVITRTAKSLRAAALIAVFAVIAASAAAGAGLEKRWSGKLGGDAQYYTPQRITAGNFAPDDGDELLILDTDGFAYFMSWNNNELANFWITSAPVVDGRALALAAADIDGDAEDEIAVIERNGDLSVFYGDKKRFRNFCHDCFPSSFSGFKGEFIAPMQADRDPRIELLVIGTWKNKKTALVLKLSGKSFKSMKAAALDVKGETLSLMPAKTPPGSRFYLHLFLGKDGDIIQPFHFDEEGIQLEAKIKLPGTLSAINTVSSADTDTDGVNEIFISGATGKGLAVKPALLQLTPGNKQPFSPVQQAMDDPAFIAAPDLNNDGIPEMFLANYSGEAEVLSSGAPSLIVNGKKKSPARNLVLKNGQAFINPSLLSGCTTKQNKSLFVITSRKSSLLLDTKSMKSSMKKPNDEEAVRSAVPFIYQDGRVFIEAQSSADALGFKAAWDMLSQTLKISP